MVPFLPIVNAGQFLQANVADSGSRTGDVERRLGAQPASGLTVDPSLPDEMIALPKVE